MSESILEVATVVGASVGVDVHEVALHPSGAWMLFTSEGKKYLEVAMDIGREDLTVAVMQVLRPVVAVVEEPKLVKAPKVKSSKAQVDE